MKLYIKFGNLYRFDKLYKSSEYLQEVLEKETGIRWAFDKEDKDEIDQLLKSRGINFDIE